MTTPYTLVTQTDLNEATWQQVKAAQRSVLPYTINRTTSGGMVAGWTVEVQDANDFSFAADVRYAHGIHNGKIVPMLIIMLPSQPDGLNVSRIPGFEVVKTVIHATNEIQRDWLANSKWSTRILCEHHTLFSDWIERLKVEFPCFAQIQYKEHPLNVSNKTGQLLLHRQWAAINAM